MKYQEILYNLKNLSEKISKEKNSEISDIIIKERKKYIKDNIKYIKEMSISNNSGGYLGKNSFYKKNLKEGYNNFKKQVTTRTPNSTSKAMVRTVKKKLREIEQVLYYSSRIQEEIGKPQINPEIIKELTQKLKDINKRLKNLNK